MPLRLHNSLRETQVPVLEEKDNLEKVPILRSKQGQISLSISTTHTNRPMEEDVSEVDSDLGHPCIA